MANDLISRQAAINDLHGKDPSQVWDTADVEVWINALPSAQPKIGRWIEDGYSNYKAVCDQCGEPCATYINGTPRDRFCKWCGAKLEG